MAYDGILNGFTGFSKGDSNFVSAADAIRQAEREARVAHEFENPYERSAERAQPARQTRTQADVVSPWSQREASFRTEAASWQRDAYAQPAYGAHQASAWASPAASKAPNVLRFATDESLAAGAAPAFDPDKLRNISEQDRRWSWIEIDLNAIRSNAAAVKSRIARGTRLLAVVKADGYGHGAVKVAKTALNSGADYLGVASLDEAIQLREAYVNAPILILCEPPEASIPLLLGYKIMPSIYTAEFAIKYAEAADAFGLRAPFHLKVNTGMNRIGVHYSEVVTFMHQVGFHRALELMGTYTHFATADCPESLDFHIQLKRFAEAVNALAAAGINPGIVHAANSAAALRYPEAQFDMVRSGLTLYGYHSCPETRGIVNLRPAMSVHARVTDTRQVPMSEGVSYGLQYRSPGSVKICTVPIGYADGLRRGLSGKVDFVCNGKRFHQVGAICMDQCMFEVDLRTYGTKRRIEPQIGDEVVIVGRQGDAEVSIEEMCHVLDTIPYELVIGFSHRMPKIYR